MISYLVVILFSTLFSVPTITRKVSRADDVDVCKMAPDSGHCNKRIIKYFYNSTSRRCEVFVYGGCQGNANNFLDKTDCEDECGQAPALEITKLKTDPRSPQHCNFEPVSGSCNWHLPRYFYNRTSGYCELFVYGGCGGNENNFQGISECEDLCSKHLLQGPASEVTFKRSIGTNKCKLSPDPGRCHKQVIRYFFNTTSRRCDIFIYGGCRGNANNFFDKSECEDECGEPPAIEMIRLKNNNNRSPEPCALQPMFGSCNGRLPRYFHNTTSGLCELFVYGGCGGNGNNFNSISDCEGVCSKLSRRGETAFKRSIDAVKCQVSPDVGACSAHIPRYFYNTTSGMCELFVYGGCDGNSNNFMSISECENNCLEYTPEYENSMRASGTFPQDPIPKDDIVQLANSWLLHTTAGYGNIDVCTMPVDPGSCYGNLPRYFYNSYTTKCELFVFKGCEGNRNNFLTRSECQEACDRPESELNYYLKANKPTRGDSPLHMDMSVDFSSHLQQKYEAANELLNTHKTPLVFIPNDQALESTFFITTAGYPSYTYNFPCLKNMDVGPCKSKIPRYYYNHKNGKCEVFNYGGCNGNENNFANLAECQAACLAHYSGDHEFQKTNGLQNQWLMMTQQIVTESTEVLDETGLMIPNPDGMRCFMTANVGACKSKLIRYYYNQTSEKCEKFIFRGCEGNANNFLSKHECEASCIRHSVHEKNTESRSDITKCFMEKKVGPCKTKLNRYFYNYTSHSCKKFTYGGCHGNGNNFISKSKCEAACKVSVANMEAAERSYDETRCLLDMKVGPCSARMNRFFYNHASNDCQNFTYGGCYGNANNFQTKSKCEAACKKEAIVDEATDRSSDSHTVRHIDVGIEIEAYEQPKEVWYLNATQKSKLNQHCLLDKEVGTCDAKLPRFHYNHKSGTCDVFVYGGCGGNDNNFLSKTECIAACVTTDSEERSAESLKIITTASSFEVTEESEEAGVNSMATGTAGNKRCLKKLDYGQCTLNLPRFYYDQSANKCKFFKYRGCMGNDNNFMSEKECQATCKANNSEDDSSEATHDVPALQHYKEAVDERPTSLTNPGPVTKRKQRCLLAMQVGPCGAKIPRFYYNDKRGKCEVFVYGGCKGNANNFETRTECMAACIKPDNHEMILERKAKYPVPKEQIPINESAVNSTVVTKDEQRCFKDTKVGPCNAKIPRFHYNHKTGQCEVFVYGGCQGNGNNFMSKTECVAACIDGVKDSDEQLSDITTQSNDDVAQMSDEATAASTAVLSTHEHPCYMGKKVGPCKAKIPRYYYNHKKAKCQVFVYGGCKGNENNFLSRIECEETCVGSTTHKDTATKLTVLQKQTTHLQNEVTETSSEAESTWIPESQEHQCFVPKMVGPCKAKIPRYYYNDRSGQCEVFVYGGCKGNDNNFMTKTQCVETCITAISHEDFVSNADQIYTGLDIEAAESPNYLKALIPSLSEKHDEQCYKNMDGGPCKGKLRRFYYSFKHGKCKSFLYGGCRGNDNNFLNKIDCETACSTSRGASYTPDRTSEPPADQNQTTLRLKVAPVAPSDGNLTTSTRKPKNESGCFLPMKIGPCNAKIPRFYYNPRRGSCEVFVYGGCKGNRNNFISRMECESTCLLTVSEVPEIRMLTHLANARPFVQPTRGAPRVIPVPERQYPLQCSLDVEVGPCESKIPRFYFDTQIGKCQVFVYGGCGGNDNNFPSRTECESTCLVNSSEEDENYAKFYATPLFRTALGMGHVTKAVEVRPNGPSIDTITEKNGNSEALDCLLAVEVGSCTSRIPRFYYNKKKGRCQVFVYGGCDGNANNFDSKTECEATCVGKKEASAEAFDSSIDGTLPKNIKAIRFEDPPTEIPDEVDAGEGLKYEKFCILPIEVGPCKANIRRYYFNSITGQCDIFVYGGCKGNENNFQSQSECESVCLAPISKEVAERNYVSPTPIVLGPVEDPNQPWFLRTNKEKSKKKHQLSSHLTPIWVGKPSEPPMVPWFMKVPEKITYEARCLAPVDGGPCKAKLPRYFFNKTTTQCEIFVYGGCEGNYNNFETKSDCESACSTPVPMKGSNDKDCILPAYRGPCSSIIPRYFYNYTTGVCELFLYGGCGGNANNFVTQEQCKSTCTPPVVKSVQHHYEEVDQSPELPQCFSQPQVGPCNMKIPRFFYNKMSGLCEPFLYGGCGGNNNNFKTRSECEDSCIHKEKPQHDNLDDEISRESQAAYSAYDTLSALTPMYDSVDIEDYMEESYRDKRETAGDGAHFLLASDERLDFSNLPSPKRKGADRCTLPLSIGDCRGNYTRYFYNNYLRTCERFMFGGCGGNANNYMSKADCLEACLMPDYHYSLSKRSSEREKCFTNVTVGPCRELIPRYFYNSQRGRCESFIYGGCAGNGNNFETDHECRSACVLPVNSNTTMGLASDNFPEEDKCFLAPEVGPCKGHLPRHFYNKSSGLCELFVYGGCGGNRNNFMTSMDCVEACVLVTIPELDFKTFLDRSKCFMNMTAGPCKQSIPRYFYNSKFGYCERFVYGGCGGNGNSFETELECINTCVLNINTVTSTDIIPANAPAMTEKVEGIVTTTEVLVDDVGTSSSELMTVAYETTTTSTSTELPQSRSYWQNMVIEDDECFLKPEVGPCQGRLPRHFYNKTSGRCELFVYGGCRGNQNNFMTLKDCVDACVLVTIPDPNTPPESDKCFLDPKTGPCKAQIPRHFHNITSGMCELFVYGGCGGNPNNFLTKKDCEESCYPAVPRHVYVVFAEEDKCVMLPERGPCDKNITRFYYNKYISMCDIFVYGGCGGNQNNFATKFECENSCAAHLKNEDNYVDGDDRCSLGLEFGPCSMHVPRFFYNFTSGICENFLYGGCEGNSNNFVSKCDCESLCGARSSTEIPKIYHSNECSMKPDTGTCNKKIPRFFFNRTSSQCEVFTFGGCGGNRNNFVSRHECEESCIYSNQVLKFNIGEKCYLNPDIGPCRANLPRYFYNKTSGFCEMFVYGGCGGNENNFHSKMYCYESCVETPLHRIEKRSTRGKCFMKMETGPCKSNSSRYFYNQTSGLCEIFFYGGCGGNENNFRSEAECLDHCLFSANNHIEKRSIKIDKCLLKPLVGSCKKYSNRYYYNITSGTCVNFTYGGCGGNENNFYTKVDCEKACYMPSLNDYYARSLPEVDTCVFAPDVGPCNRNAPRYFYNKTSSACEVFFYGGCGGNLNNYKTKADCENKCDKSGTSAVDSEKSGLKRCFMLPDIGTCRKRLTRYYYNQHSSSCEKFIFGGCNGNANNFISKALCEGTCIVPLIHELIPDIEEGMDRCSLLPEAGTCLDHTPRYFYNISSGFCEHFVYGGCRGNQNNFISVTDCEAACVSPVMYDDEVGNYTEPSEPQDLDRCLMRPSPGQCRLKLPRYYYDHSSRRCETFVYGGCGGNRNNFMAEALCQIACMHMSPDTATVRGDNGTSKCSMKPSSGDCKLKIPRFYYNPKTERCDSFVYGGCGGNPNNFVSKSVCESTCTSRSVTKTKTNGNDKCFMEADTGPCDLILTRYFYNFSIGMCEPFIYGGCGGNWNNFASIKDCDGACATPFKIELPSPLSESNGNEPNKICDGDCVHDSDVDTLKRPPSHKCSLKPEVGICKMRLHRYFYNSTSGTCQPFIYGGCGGNHNNFLSKDLCQIACLERLSQKSNNNNMKTQDQCAMNINVGWCNMKLRRYFFNKNLGVCESFIFGGCGGNLNNFKSLDDCENSCVMAKNTNEVDDPVHVMKLDKCALQQNPGDCQMNFTRYFFNKNSGRCEMFLFGGCGGNQNNFISKNHCEGTCMPQRPKYPSDRTEPATDLKLDRCFMPPDVGPCRNYTPRYFHNKNNGICQSFIYGGCGGNVNNFASKTDCETACDAPSFRENESINLINMDQCSLPPKIGDCIMKLPRFYFNKTSGTCENFIYGGCGGNRNNFASTLECHKACGYPAPIKPFKKKPLQVIKVDKCLMPPDVGPCKNYTPRFFFNKTSGLCENFLYGGCKGNENSFVSKTVCYYSCMIPPSDYIRADIPRGKPKAGKRNKCLLPPESGACSGRLPRFYYNKKTGKCEVFVYGGCKGNANNFEAKSLCEKACVIPSNEGLRVVPKNYQLTSNCSTLPFLKSSHSRYVCNRLTGHCENILHNACKPDITTFLLLTECKEFCAFPPLLPDVPSMTEGIFVKKGPTKKPFMPTTIRPPKASQDSKHFSGLDFI